MQSFTVYFRAQTYLVAFLIDIILVFIYFPVHMYLKVVPEHNINQKSTYKKLGECIIMNIRAVT